MNFTTETITEALRNRAWAMQDIVLTGRKSPVPKRPISGLTIINHNAAHSSSFFHFETMEDVKGFVKQFEAVRARHKLNLSLVINL